MNVVGILLLNVSTSIFLAKLNWPKTQNPSQKNEVMQNKKWLKFVFENLGKVNALIVVTNSTMESNYFDRSEVIGIIKQ